MVLYGIMKGSCGAPIFWSLVSRLIMEELANHKKCFHLISVEGSFTNQQECDAYADDATTGVNDDLDTDDEILENSVFSNDQTALV